MNRTDTVLAKVAADTHILVAQAAGRNQLLLEIRDLLTKLTTQPEPEIPACGVSHPTEVGLICTMPRGHEGIHQTTRGTAFYYWQPHPDFKEGGKLPGGTPITGTATISEVDGHPNGSLQVERPSTPIEGTPFAVTAADPIEEWYEPCDICHVTVWKNLMTEHLEWHVDHGHGRGPAKPPPLMGIHTRCPAEYGPPGHTTLRACVLDDGHHGEHTARDGFHWRRNAETSWAR